MEATKTDISANDIKQKMQNNEDFVLVDTLSRESFLERHIPCSINLPLKYINKYAEAVLPDKNQEIITYCKNVNCKTSVMAVEQLNKMGYTNVAHYSGGLEGWKEAGLELASSGQTEHAEEC